MTALCLNSQYQYRLYLIHTHPHTHTHTPTLHPSYPRIMSQLVEPVGVVLINQTRKVVKSTNDDNSTTRKVPTGPTDTHD